MCGIRTLILDFDGVLVESKEEKTAAFKELFSFYPEYEQQMLDYHYQFFSTSRMEKFRFFVFELMKRPGDSDRVTLMAEKFSNLVMKRVVSCPEVPGAKEFLKEFSQQFPCYVSSATPQEELRDIIRCREFEPYFKDIYGDPPIRKKRAIQTILERENVSPEESLFIGDAMSDFLVAREMGVKFIGRNSGLPFHGVDIELYNDMFDIAEVIRQQLGENPP